MQLWKKCVFVGVGIIAVFAIIAIVYASIASSRKNDDNISSGGEWETGDTDEKIDFSQMLVVEKDFCNLIALDLNKKSKTFHLVGDVNNNEICHFDFFMTNTLFYSSGYSSIKSWSKKYPEISIISTGQSSAPGYVLAVDFISDKIYGISTDDSIESNKLIIIDIRNNQYGIVLTDLSAPQHLAVDPGSALLFIGQMSSILRANTDGTGLKKIVEMDGISELAVDRQAKRIYWTNLVSIESSDYAGDEHRVIVKIANPITSLTVLSSRLFWLEPPHGMDIYTTIWTYNVTNQDACANNSVSEIPFSYPKLIKAYDLDEMESIRALRINPCNGDNAGCEHLCLLTNDAKGFSCACYLGYRLNEDLHTCSSATDVFLLYSQGSYFKGRIIDPPSTETNKTPTTFTDAIYPNRFTLSQLVVRKVIEFDYDYRENRIYYADDNFIFDRSLMIDQPSNSFANPTSKVGQLYVAVDWVSGNIYCTTDDYGGLVWVYRRVNWFVVSKRLTYVEGSYRLTSIVVHPNRGYVFFLMYDISFNYYSQIYRMNCDGSDLVNFLKDRKVQTGGLGIDYLENRLYWFNDDGIKLESIAFDGSMESLISIDISYVSAPRTINLHRGWAYVSNLTSVWQLDKITGHSATRLLDSTFPGGADLVAGARIYGREAQPLVSGHPCAVRNGGCQVFCYAVPSKTRSGALRRQCGCDNLTDLQGDGRTCVGGKAENLRGSTLP